MNRSINESRHRAMTPVMAPVSRHPLSPWVTALLLLWLLGGCSPHPHDTLPTEVFQTAALTKQEGRLYVQARLTDPLLEKILAVAQRGEPILVTYRFHLKQLRDPWPDRAEADLSVARRLRLHLITERYEMRNLEQDVGQRTTTDVEEARQFIGDPGYLPLIDEKALIADRDYRLEITFRSERDGVSRLFRILDRWLTFWKPEEYLHHISYRHQALRGEPEPSQQGEGG